MWAFLVTEIMLFGGIFMAYIAYRWAFPEIWESAATHLNTPLATVNTVVLLVSSLTVALSVASAEAGNYRRVVVLLLVTMVLGATFLGIKGYEYSEKFAHCNGYATPLDWATNGAPLGEVECLVPGRAFIYPEAHGEAAAGEAGHSADSELEAAPEVNVALSESEAATVPIAGQGTPYQLFYLLYFCATGLHAIHMVIGLTVVGVITWMTARGKFSPAYFTPIEIGGLYWHLIDIVWVFLFPLFYLV